MKTRLLQSLLPYLLAIAAPAAITLLGSALSGWLGNNIPCLLFFGPVIFMAWFNGGKPALLSVAVSALAMSYFFYEPFYYVDIHDPAEQVEIALFVVVGLVVIFLFSTRRAAEERSRLLKDVDQRKDEFLAILAHELRNPLVPIRTALHIIRVAGDNRSTIEQAVGMMERQVQQMVRLIDDLMDVSRIIHGKLPFHKERIELAAAVRNAVETSLPVIEAAGHEITVTIPPEPIVLQADLARLTQVFLNLLNNAARYTRGKGHIALSVARIGVNAVVKVSDDGIGIPANKLPHVFDLFTQVDSSSLRSQAGLGIGLSLVRQLVEMHGGSVHAESAGPGLGSAFTVSLPVQKTLPNSNQELQIGSANDGSAEISALSATTHKPLRHWFLRLT